MEEENWQPTIDAAWEMRSPEDYDDKFSTVKNDFLRKWHHSRSAKPISLEEMMEDENGDIFGVADPADGVRKPVHPISSGLLFWKKVLCGICSW